MTIGDESTKWPDDGKRFGAADFHDIEVSFDGPIGRIVLNRPTRHNAQTVRMWRELDRAGAALAADPTVRVVVISGNGPSFSSGIDLGELGEDGFFSRRVHRPSGADDELVAAIRLAQNAVRWIHAAPVLVIAAVHGVALGAGFQLALSCDVRLVADDCRLQLPEVDHGLVPDLGATVELPRLVGAERALDLMLTGREITGADAVGENLALRSLPPSELAAGVDRYAVAAARNSRTAIGAVKRSIRHTDYRVSMDEISLGQAACIRETLGRREVQP